MGVVSKESECITGFRHGSGLYFSLNTAVEFITFIVLLYDITEATSGQARHNSNKTSGKVAK